MPNRILREGILSSERVNLLSWEAEVFYRRLMSVVDDFGRFTAHPSLLRAALYPLKLDTVRDANVERLLAECERASLVRVYEVADASPERQASFAGQARRERVGSSRRFLELLDFRQQVRSKESKYPQPPDECAADAQQMHSNSAASAHLDVFGDGDGDGDGDGGKARKRATPPKRPEGVDPQTWEDWLQLRKAKRAPVTETVVAGAAAEAQKAGMPLGDFLAVWCRRGSQGLEAAWLKPEERSHGRPPPPESFRERDARLAAESVARWTGGLAHDKSAMKPLPFESGHETIEGEAVEQRRLAAR